MENSELVNNLFKTIKKLKSKDKTALLKKLISEYNFDVEIYVYRCASCNKIGSTTEATEDPKFIVCMMCGEVYCEDCSGKMSQEPGFCKPCHEETFPCKKSEAEMEQDVKEERAKKISTLTATMRRNGKTAEANEIDKTIKMMREAGKQ